MSADYYKVFLRNCWLLLGDKRWEVAIIYDFLESPRVGYSLELSFPWLPKIRSNIRFGTGLGSLHTIIY